jgi:hypothetical protein
MTFNVKSKQKEPSLYTFKDGTQRQNIWVKPFSCTLVANSIAIKFDSSTSFVLVFNFVNYKIKYFKISK